MEDSVQNSILNILARYGSEETMLNHRTGATLTKVKHLLKIAGWKISKTGERDFPKSVIAMGFDIVPAKLANGKDHKTVRVISL